jgi:hypothetical protein
MSASPYSTRTTLESPPTPAPGNHTGYNYRENDSVPANRRYNLRSRLPRHRHRHHIRDGRPRKCDAAAKAAEIKLYEPINFTIFADYLPKSNMAAAGLNRSCLKNLSKYFTSSYSKRVGNGIWSHDYSSNGYRKYFYLAVPDKDLWLDGDDLYWCSDYPDKCHE